MHGLMNCDRRFHAVIIVTLDYDFVRYLKLLDICFDYVW